MEIRWAKEAVSDLDNIQKYIADDDANIAVEIIFYILDKIEFWLPKYKHLGHAGRVLGTRELILSQYPYIIVYTVKNNCLYVVRILHSLMKYPE